MRFLPLLLLLTGCSLLASPDPQRADAYRLRAETAVAEKDYRGGADLLRKALPYAPHDGSLALRQGELLERIGDLRGARKTYRRGLKHAGKTSQQQILAWRLGLLLALQLDAPAKAQPLLEQIPAGTPWRADLLGVLALQDARPREALLHFNQALAAAGDEQTAATVLYHVALAYSRVGDEKNTLGSLFHAINRADHLGVIGDLERLWDALIADPSPL
jgi:tetratricopeptide (TPR) repeat protein